MWVFLYTSATNLLYGLKGTTTMLMEEGLANGIVRHQRRGCPTRIAVEFGELEVLASDLREYWGLLSAVLMSAGRGEDALRRLILEPFDLSAKVSESCRGVCLRLAISAGLTI